MSCDREVLAQHGHVLGRVHLDAHVSARAERPRHLARLRSARLGHRCHARHFLLRARRPHQRVHHAMRLAATLLYRIPDVGVLRSVGDVVVGEVQRWRVTVRM